MGATQAISLRIVPTLAGVFAHWVSRRSEGWIAAPDEAAVMMILRERFPAPSLDVSLEVSS